MLGTPNFQLAGRHIGGSTFTGYDLVWTSTAFNMNIPYDLYISGSGVVPDNHDDQKYDGHTVRYISLHISWRLPTGGSGGEYALLTTFYNSSASIRSVNGPHFALNGNRDAGTTYNQGDGGHYWTRTSTSSGNSYYFAFNTSIIVAPTSHYKYAGFGVRL